MPSCPFCNLDPGRIRLENEHAVAFRDSSPVTQGHTLVIPRRHVGSLYELSMDEQAAVWDLASRMRLELLGTMRPDGFNIGLNDGPAAGQTIDHAHVHIIPRRLGDVPDPRGGIRWVVAGQSKVLERIGAPSHSRRPDSLSDQYQRLLAEGLFTATYKYALLAALADLSVESGDDSGTR